MTNVSNGVVSEWFNLHHLSLCCDFNALHSTSYEQKYYILVETVVTVIFAKNIVIQISANVNTIKVLAKLQTMITLQSSFKNRLILHIQEAYRELEKFT